MAAEDGLLVVEGQVVASYAVFDETEHRTKAEGFVLSSSGVMHTLVDEGLAHGSKGRTGGSPRCLSYAERARMKRRMTRTSGKVYDILHENALQAIATKKQSSL
ncbi:MAG: hypothetical protein VB144_04905 [Clostridia bacterium]|nr:hypothetical protein [Clostridia bacterium]